MAINAQELVDSLAFALDAEGADHYGDNEDYKPAINLAQRWLTNLINRTMSHKKFGEEILRELIETRVFELNADSRLSLSELPTELWTVLAVYPNPVTGNSGEVDNIATTTLREDLYHKSSPSSSKRLTWEEWTYNLTNPFTAGNESKTACADLAQFAYLPITGTNGVQYLEVRPKPANNRATVVLVRKPKQLVDTSITPFANQTIEFPDSVFDILFNKALSYISYKQGDSTNLFTVSETDIRLLLNTVL